MSRADNTVNRPEDFFVVTREPGAENPAIPTWANRSPNPAQLEHRSAPTLERIAVPEVPGAFQLLNVLSPEECQRLIGITESLGYLGDAAVSLPRRIRHNDNVTWVVDEATDASIWSRCAHYFGDQSRLYNGRKAVGLNARFRFYRYSKGDYFKPHIDGDWPGSRVIDEELIGNAYPDRYSCMTFLLLLNDDFEGGATQFLLDADAPKRPARDPEQARRVNVRTPLGAALCFPHGRHPLQCLHSSEPLVRGVKYIARTDVLFQLRQ
ncbi:MAG: 2OG-Fe(II) oxygenase [Halieaceae bacterium]|nr:2OG-Fe(II) oxygenase [Halieaceae bacterium]